MKRDCEPTASLTADLSVGSTLKASAMQFVAISMFSASSEVRVPSLREVERKSVIESASRFFESGRDFDGQYDRQSWEVDLSTYHFLQRRG